MSGFERATKSHSWLADAGLCAGPAQVTAAGQALDQGRHLGNLDLVEFVRAVLESEQAEASEADGILTLTIPPDWAQALEGAPGWEAQDRRFRLTTDPAVLRDNHGAQVGYLGRAHPLVRRALGRVRSLAGGTAGSAIDRRVTAVSGDGPALVHSCLCRVRREVGGEFERVFAVRSSPAGARAVFQEPHEWMTWAGRDRQVPTAGIWEQHFAIWGPEAEAAARAAATTEFTKLAEPVLEALRGEAEAERGELSRWLAYRTLELCGEPARQLRLGEAPAATWQTGSDPVQRLSAFAAEPGQRPAKRQEAQGILSLYRARSTLLDRRATLRVLPPQIIGLLMIVPKGKA